MPGAPSSVLGLLAKPLGTDGARHPPPSAESRRSAMLSWPWTALLVILLQTALICPPGPNSRTVQMHRFDEFEWLAHQWNSFFDELLDGRGEGEALTMQCLRRAGTVVDLPLIRIMNYCFGSPFTG